MTYSEYSFDSEVGAFFKKTAVIRATCDARAKELAGGSVAAVEVQGACSYTVYAGPELEYVVQFRLKSLALKLDVVMCTVHLHRWYPLRELLEGGGGAALRHLMKRMRGITHVDFIRVYGFPEDSPDNISWRKNLIEDIAQYVSILAITDFAMFTPVSFDFRSSLANTYNRDLRLLQTALPSRFLPSIQTCIDSMNDILSCNIIVDEKTCHIVGVIDWAEAEVAPFGLNLHSLQSITGKLHLRDGWMRYRDFDSLQAIFWENFSREAGGLPDNQLRTIKLAMILGLLLSHGFTRRLANEPEPVPIGDDEQGRYNMMTLDGFLINLDTRF
ncbi:hypothetical protein PG994_015124 [Apiospora phragmitis]|uniref:Aminoglycoside phosphotransferase domain-containing protein n=1 Tax=Apiospora phragmitis TaxID=2905665 RepID=A0ABR1SVK1_9PEZI